MAQIGPGRGRRGSGAAGGSDTGGAGVADEGEAEGAQGGRDLRGLAAAQAGAALPESVLHIPPPRYQASTCSE